jgi:hypothetical protein
MARSAFLELVALAQSMYKDSEATPPTPRELAAGEVVDRYLVLRDEMKDGHRTQRIYLRYPEGGATAEEELAEGVSLKYRREWLRLVLVRMVLEAQPLVAQQPEEVVVPPDAPVD